MKQTAVEFLMDKLFDPAFDPEKQIDWFKQALQIEEEQKSCNEEDLNKHVVDFLEWRREYFAVFHGKKNNGLFYAIGRYGCPYYNEDKHTPLTRKYYNLDELLELFNKFQKKETKSCGTH